MPAALAFLWTHRLAVLGLLLGLAIGCWLSLAFTTPAVLPPLSRRQERQARANSVRLEQAAATDTARAGCAARAAAPAYAAGQQAAATATRLHRFTHAPAPTTVRDSAAERLQRQLAAY